MIAPARKRTFLLVTGLLALVFAIVFALQWQVRERAREQLPVNTRMGGDFTLPSTRGLALDTRSLRGKVVLLNFGFTSCPDVCPLVLARLRQVVKSLGTDAAGVQVLFVSFDPARDALPGLKTYVEHFHPDFIGMTGSDAEIAAVAARYGVVYLKENTGSAAGYGFAHSDYIYLLDGAGQLRKLYDTQARTDDIAADVRLLQSAERRLF